MRSHSTNAPKSECRKQRNQSPFERVNWNAAGIDIGSEAHYVAVGADKDGQPVRIFGCYTSDLKAMASWLLSCGIETVALESTGVYWINVYQMLVEHGLEVKVVNARHVRNVPGRKSDVMDCQWLQELHTYGLLSGSFVPDRAIGVLRSYWRHRENLVQAAASQTHLMQKALELMNIQLHKALTDITGKTGMSIVRAIVQGERDTVKLAQMRHRLVKSSADEMAKALEGHYREEHLFALKQSLHLYDTYRVMILECDEQIAAYMKTLEARVRDAEPGPSSSNSSKKRSRRKNEPAFDLRAELLRVAGVDLTKIDGLDALTVQTIISECGLDMSRFPTEKNFASWLGLCPNNRITGGKVKKTRTKKVKNRAAQAFRLAAQSLSRSKTAIGAFLRRMKQRLGKPQAITATAHKIARLFYRMLKHGESYVDIGQQAYEKQYQERVMRSLINRAKIMGFELVCSKTGEVVS